MVILQIAFQKFIFQCPDVGYRQFSFLFFFAPALPLLCLGWLSNSDFQNSIRGLCHSVCNKEKRRKTRLRIRWRSLIKTVISSHIYAYVAPYTWFVMCLLNKKIMTCCVYGPPSLNRSANAGKRYVNLEIYSQLIGFDMIMITAAVVSIMVTIQECFKKANPGKGIYIYKVLLYIYIIIKREKYAIP